MDGNTPPERDFLADVRGKILPEPRMIAEKTYREIKYQLYSPEADLPQRYFLCAVGQEGTPCIDTIDAVTAQLAKERFQNWPSTPEEEFAHDQTLPTLEKLAGIRSLDDADNLV